MNKPPHSSQSALLPGATLGIIGGGQLGRYFVIAARKMGYDVAVLDPSADAPAMQLASYKIVAAYDDSDGLQQLAKLSDAVTIEFENVPFNSLVWLADKVPVAPSPECARIAQDRRIEKRVAKEHGLTPAPNATIESVSDIGSAIDATGVPAILKTATLGYDGKGQAVCESHSDVEAAFNALNGVPCVLEKRIDLKLEVSVVLCRGQDGISVCFPIAENVHVNGILDLSTAPAAIDDAMAEQVRAQAIKLADGIDYVGVLGVEFFIAKDGIVYFNEMAPRPHNSGHYTLDATASCQFEQQVRMLCGLPAGSARLLTPVTMLNILGDSWGGGDVSGKADGETSSNAVGDSLSDPNWGQVGSEISAKLHLYGKVDARPGRKMGHINCLADSPKNSLATAERVRTALNR